MRKTYVIGGLNRSAFRRSLQAANIQYVEDKTLLDSQFVVTATESQHRIICQYIDQVNYQADLSYFDFRVKNDGAAEFAAYLDMFAPEATYEKKKGWFKTRFSVCCHPKLAKVFLEASKNFN